jgi:hypothetical protein
MFKKLFLLIFFIILALGIYYVASVFIDRNSGEGEESPVDKAKEHIEKIIKNESLDQDDDENTPGSVTIEQEEEPVGETQLSDQEESSAYDITREDCDNECTNYENGEKEYCRNICGLTGTKQDIVASCDDLNSLEKDYCIRDNAVQEQDLQKCDEIEDSGIKQQCQNRIQEDIIDEIM